VAESTRSTATLGLFDVGMGVQTLLDADGQPIVPKLTASKGLHALLHHTDNDGAIKLRGFPSECFERTVKFEDRPILEHCWRHVGALGLFC
jgi:hypothetical protein